MFTIDYAIFDKKIGEAIISYSEKANLTLNEVTKEVVKDINKNIVEQKNLTGEQARPLKKSTIFAKQKKGSPYPSRIFYDKGILAKPSSIKWTKVVKNTNLVFVTSSRALILKYLAEKGRNPFGLTPFRFSQLVSNFNKFKK